MSSCHFKLPLMTASKKTASVYLFLSSVSIASAALALLFADQVLFRLINAFSAPIETARSVPMAERLTVATYHPILGYDGIPNIRERVAGALVEQNADGNRGPYHKCAPGQEPATVLVSGDSFAWGYGVAEENTVAAAVARQYRESVGVAPVVLNFGVSGYGPDQSLLKYLLYGRECRPKLVVLMVYVGNDPSEVQATVAWGAEKPRFFFSGKRLCLTNIPPPRAKGWPHSDIRSLLRRKFPWLDSEISIGPMRLSLRHSQALEYLSRREFLVTLGGRSAGLDRVRGGEKVQAEFKCYEDNPSNAELQSAGPLVLLARIIWRFQRVVKADGGQFRVVLIPRMEQQKQAAPDGNYIRLVQLLRQYQVPVTDFFNSDGVPPEASLTNRADAWRADLHLSEAGSEIVAARILHDARRDGQL